MDPENDATPSGVSQEQTTDIENAQLPSGSPDGAAEDGENKGPPMPTERPLTPREIAMNAITVRRESDDEAPAPAPAPPAAAPAPAATPESSQIEQQLVDEPRVLTEGLDKVMVLAKIDGVEQQVSVADLTRQYQKNGAADKRLAEATQLLREAKALAAPPVRVEDAQGNPDSSPAPKPAGDGTETAKAFVTALFEGDEAKALAALTNLGIGRSEGSTQIDVNQLASQLTPAVRQQLVEESALEKFGRDYSDIVADPYLADIADRFLAQGLKDGKSYPEAMDEAGKLTRGWLAAKAPAPSPSAPPPTTDRNAKLNRKAGIDEVPAVNKTATSTQEPPQTPTQVIEEMKKARGLTS